MTKWRNPKRSAHLLTPRYSLIMGVDFMYLHSIGVYGLLYHYIFIILEYMLDQDHTPHGYELFVVNQNFVAVE